MTHLARIRFPWTAFQAGSPSGPQPTVSKKIGKHLLIDSPLLLQAADIDLYLSDTGTPYWPNEQQARTDNATMGPLCNDADQLLTAVSWRRSLADDPANAELEKLAEHYPGRRERIIVTNRDEAGFLWIREIVAPAGILRQYDEDELRAAAGIPPRSS